MNWIKLFKLLYKIYFYLFTHLLTELFSIGCVRDISIFMVVAMTIFLVNTHWCLFFSTDQITR